MRNNLCGASKYSFAIQQKYLEWQYLYSLLKIEELSDLRTRGRFLYDVPFSGYLAVSRAHFSLRLIWTYCFRVHSKNVSVSNNIAIGVL